MLKIKKQSIQVSAKLFASLALLIGLIGGGYIASLFVSPIAAPLFATKPIAVQSLPTPKSSDNRLVIPKIGVNIPYSNSGEQSLESGAWWRDSTQGNPATGGNFIVSAHRFKIQPTPMATIEKSPLYNVDKLAVGDKLVVDYKGVRYGYEVATIAKSSATIADIERPSETAKLTLYTYETDKATSERIVLTAKSLGKVDLGNR